MKADYILLECYMPASGTLTEASHSINARAYPPQHELSTTQMTVLLQIVRCLLFPQGNGDRNSLPGTTCLLLKYHLKC